MWSMRIATLVTTHFWGKRSDSVDPSNSSCQESHIQQLERQLHSLLVPNTPRLAPGSLALRASEDFQPIQTDQEPHLSADRGVLSAEGHESISGEQAPKEQAASKQLHRARAEGSIQRLNLERPSEEERIVVPQKSRTRPSSGSGRIDLRRPGARMYQDAVQREKAKLER